MFEFLVGFIFGVFCIIITAFLFIYIQFSQKNTSPKTIDQFQNLEMPEELKKFLNIDNLTSSSTPRVESCFSISALLHFLFQEHKDTRLFRRWLHKRLQLEINDISSRNAAAHYIIQSVKIRDLDVGSKFPIIKNISVENIKMCNDDNSVESLSLLVDLFYTGNFYTSIFASTIFGDTFIGVKITKLEGKAKIIMSRDPYPHWAFSFTNVPHLELAFETQLGGVAAQYCTPIIEKQFRNVIQKKQVWPNYKVRYRPFFPNPLMQPTASPKAFNHVDIRGGLQVNILEGSRLPIQILNGKKAIVYCAVFLDPKPFANFNANCNHVSTIMINFPRHDQKEPLGLTFIKHCDDFGSKKIKIESVALNSSAADAGFRQGDIILSVNNVVVSNSNHGIKLLNTKGDLSVLVERENDDLFRSDTPDLIQECLDEELVDIEFNITNDKDNQIIITSLSNNTNEKKDDIIKESDNIPIPCDNISLSESLPKSSPDNLLFDKQSIQDVYPTINEEKCEKTIFSQNLRKVGSEIRPVSMIESSNIDNMFKWNSVDNLSCQLKDKADDTTNNENQNDEKSISNNSNISMSKNDLDNLSIATDDCSEDTDSLVELKTGKKRTKLAAKYVQMVNKLAVTKSKVNNMIKSRREKNLENDHEKDNEHEEIQEGEEATEENMFNNDYDSIYSKDSIISSLSGVKQQKRPISLEVPVVDGFKSKVKNVAKGIRSKRSNHESNYNEKENLNELGKENDVNIFAKNTNSVKLKSKVKWNDELFFTLEKNCTKYLNVLVYAKYDEEFDNEDKENKNDKDSNTKSKSSKDTLEEIDSNPILLGYTSIFIPQIIDDCNLTLSKCHCEVFDLRPTKNSNFQFTNSLNISNKPEDGLTNEMLHKNNTLNSDKKNYNEDSIDCSNKVTITSENSSKDKTCITEKEKFLHTFTVISGKKNDSYICGICKTKHWFAGLIKCSTCNLIVHSKGCSEKAYTDIECISVYQDSDFEDLDSTLLSQNFSKDNNLWKRKSNSDVQDKDSLQSTPDRNSILDRSSLRSIKRGKFSEKVSSGIKFLGKAYNRGHKNESKGNISPNVNLIKLDDVIHDHLVSLECPLKLRQLMFEPNNAYNETVIKNVKELGNISFNDVTDIIERKEKNNIKITEVQKIISQLANQRKEKLLANSGISQNNLNNVTETLSNDEQKEDLIEMDLKLQALALVMIHYCEGLSSCDATENG
ncbi:PDZ domain-containing protein [Strongyloides ratti]|uniref:PDZ domain-containing protein n=1 Tax=Strongyloides ratti TaxID=34506 RepID=A0A090KQI5_STRRB|nr:PDZ domain-containing protein [Strongyloides ratti]CEF59783.1 PDZ domain-containing protein [Strongyloides ratti]